MTRGSYPTDIKWAVLKEKSAGKLTSKKLWRSTELKIYWLWQSRYCICN